jgi:hypothetical protein
VASLLLLTGCGGSTSNQPVNLKGGLPVGAVLSLTGNANVYGQDQKIGLELAQAALKPGSVLPLQLRIEDGGSDEAGATSAFNLLIKGGTAALIGPTLSQQAFAADPSPDAFPRLVDQLLASPAFGERQARRWMDIARYADTKGYVFQEDRSYPYAYTNCFANTHTNTYPYSHNISFANTHTNTYPNSHTNSNNRQFSFI